MAKLAKRQMIQVPPDVYEDLYAIKGPERTFGQMIRELIDAAFPPERDDTHQTTLLPGCPSCGNKSLKHDSDGDYYCTTCGYEPEPEEVEE